MKATCDACGNSCNLWAGSKLIGQRCRECHEGTMRPGSALDIIARSTKPAATPPTSRYDQLVRDYGQATADRIRAMEKAEAKLLKKSS